MVVHLMLAVQLLYYTNCTVNTAIIIIGFVNTLKQYEYNKVLFMMQHVIRN